MKQLISMPVGKETAHTYPDLISACQQARCDGLEVMWCGDALPPIPRAVSQGYHLAYYPDWLDFWREDWGALERKFGGREVWEDFYGGGDRGQLLRYLSADLDRAELLGVEYVSFRVSDSSIEESFTYQWEHTDEAVIDAAAEILNQVFEGRKTSVLLLVENQWWPGFNFTDPRLTARLLDAIEYPNKGIMLDVGHVMNCNYTLRTEKEGAAFLNEMLDRHGTLCQQIRAVRLHQSLSGRYVREHMGHLPANLPESFYLRYSMGCNHVFQIDQHQPWHHKSIRGVLERIDPGYLVHELRNTCPADLLQRIRVQQRTLGMNTVERQARA